MNRAPGEGGGRVRCLDEQKVFPQEAQLLLVDYRRPSPTSYSSLLYLSLARPLPLPFTKLSLRKPLPKLPLRKISSTSRNQVNLILLSNRFTCVQWSTSSTSGYPRQGGLQRRKSQIDSSHFPFSAFPRHAHLLLLLQHFESLTRNMFDSLNSTPYSPYLNLRPLAAQVRGSIRSFGSWIISPLFPPLPSPPSSTLLL